MSVVIKSKYVQAYMLNSFTRYDNTIVMKKKIKKHEDDLLQELKSLGLNCELIDTGHDHYVVQIKSRGRLEGGGKYGQNRNDKRGH